MTTLAALRARLQVTLDDAGAVYWTTAELDEHIQAALRDLSHYIPQKRKTGLATTNGSRDISVAGMVDPIRFVAVEFPTGGFPENFQPFRIWGTTLTMLGDVLGNGSNANIWWESFHTINGGSTLDTDEDETLKFGAAALACDQQAADASNSINTGGQQAPRDWSALARQYRARYEDRRDNRRGIRTGQLYTPYEPLPTQSSDPGP